MSSIALTRRCFIAGFGTLPLAGCGNTPPRSFSERVTLTVTTPEGVISGSSVIRFDSYFQDGWLGGLAGHAALGVVKGEATVVDLGRRGLLLALLNVDPARKQSVKPAGYTMIVYPELWKQARREGADDPSQTRQEAIYVDLINRRKPHGEVPLDNLSLLVRIRDPNDPRTIERVDPSSIQRAFGPGVTLTKATFAVTDELPTTGLEKKIPWLIKPHSMAGIVPSEGPPTTADRTPFVNKLLYDDFWENMQ